MEKSFEKGDDSYRQFHELVQMGCKSAKPKNYQVKQELTETQAKEALALRRKYLDELTKKDSEYKDLAEELYYLIISKADKNDEGVEEDKMKVMIIGKIMNCKASDIVWKEMGFDEQQIEEGIEKWQLKEERTKKNKEEPSKAEKGEKNAG